MEKKKSDSLAIDKDGRLIHTSYEMLELESRILLQRLLLWQLTNSKNEPDER